MTRIQPCARVWHAGRCGVAHMSTQCHVTAAAGPTAVVPSLLLLQGHEARECPAGCGRERPPVRLWHCYSPRHSCCCCFPTSRSSRRNSGSRCPAAEHWGGRHVPLLRQHPAPAVSTRLTQQGQQQPRAQRGGLGWQQWWQRQRSPPAAAAQEEHGGDRQQCQHAKRLPWRLLSGRGSAGPPGSTRHRQQWGRLRQQQQSCSRHKARRASSSSDGGWWQQWRQQCAGGGGASRLGWDA